MTSRVDRERQSGPSVTGLGSVMRTVVPITIAGQLVAFLAAVIPAHLLGATGNTDAYYLAFSVPVVATAIGMSAIQLGAIPVLSDTYAVSDRSPSALGQAVSQLIAVALSASLFIAGAATGLALLLLPELGHSVSKQSADLARLMVLELAPLPPLAVLSGTLSAALNVRRHYALPVAVLMLDPIARIICVVAARDVLGVQALVLGNVLAACIAPAVLLTAVRGDEVPVQLLRPRWTPLLKRVVKLAGPLALASTILVANPVVDRVMVTTLGVGSVTQFELGSSISRIPLALFVTALIAPMTARWRELIRDRGFSSIQPVMLKILRILLVGVVPLVVAIVMLRQEIVMGILQGGAYGSEDVDGSAAVLGGLVIGLPAQMAVPMLTVAFIASEDVVVPVVFAIANVVVNAALDLILRGPLGLTGVALSTAVTVTVLTGAELMILERRIGSLNLSALRSSLLWLLPVLPLLYLVISAIHGLLPEATNRPTALLVATATLLAGALAYCVALAVVSPRTAASRIRRFIAAASFNEKEPCDRMRGVTSYGEDETNGMRFRERSQTSSRRVDGW